MPGATHYAHYTYPIDSKRASEAGIILDIDGVILDLDSAMRGVIHKLLGVDVTIQDTWCYSFEEALGLSRPTMARLWPALWAERVDCFPGALDFVRAVPGAIGLSSRPGAAAKEASRRELDRQGFAHLEVIYVDSPLEKEIYWRRGVTYVDDNQVHAATAAELGATTFLITRPWNERCADLGAYKRVSTYVDLINNIA